MKAPTNAAALIALIGCLNLCTVGAYDCKLSNKKSNECIIDFWMKGGDPTQTDNWEVTTFGQDCKKQQDTIPVGGGVNLSPRKVSMYKDHPIWLDIVTKNPQTDNHPHFRFGYRDVWWNSEGISTDRHLNCDCPKQTIPGQPGVPDFDVDCACAFDCPH